MPNLQPLSPVWLVLLALLVPSTASHTAGDQKLSAPVAGVSGPGPYDLASSVASTCFLAPKTPSFVLSVFGRSFATYPHALPKDVNDVSLSLNETQTQTLFFIPWAACHCSVSPLTVLISMSVMAPAATALALVLVGFVARPFLPPWMQSRPFGNSATIPPHLFFHVPPSLCPGPPQVLLLAASHKRRFAALLLCAAFPLCVEASGETPRIINSVGNPVNDYYNVQTGSGLKLWLKPSRTLLVKRGLLKDVLQRNHLVLDERAATKPNAYLGYSLVLGGETQIVTAYTGDANGDGDLDDVGDAQLWTDRAFGPATFLEPGQTEYKIFNGFSVSPSEQHIGVPGNPLLQWASASKTVLLAGEVWANTESPTEVALGVTAPTEDDSFVGLSLSIGDISRAIIKYDGSTRRATVSPGFPQAPFEGATYKIIRVMAAQVQKLPLSEGWVQSLSSSPNMRFQLDTSRRANRGSYVGLEIAVTTDNITEASTITADAENGFVTVNMLARPVTLQSTYVIYSPGPTVNVDPEKGLNRLATVAFAGSGSFLDFDNVVAMDYRKPERRQLSSFKGNSTTSYSENATVCDVSSPKKQVQDTRKRSTTMTVISLVRPHGGVETQGRVSWPQLASGLLEPGFGDYFYQSGALQMRLGGTAQNESQLYTGMEISLLQDDNTEFVRLIMSYTADRVITLNESIPVVLDPRHTRFFVTTTRPTAEFVSLGTDASWEAGLYVGMYLTVEGESRRITHHGAYPHSSMSNGRVVTVCPPFSRKPDAGKSRYTISTSRSFLSLTGENYRGFHVDIGVDQEILTHGDSEVSDVYRGAVVHGSIQSIHIDVTGKGYLGGGVWRASDRSAWGQFSCDENGSIVGTTVQNGGQYYSSEMSLSSGLGYPADCGGKTRDTRGCNEKIQDGSFTSIQILQAGLNYVAAELRANGGGGYGFLAELLTDNRGSVTDFVFPDAQAHGSQYTESDPQLKVYYPGTDHEMTSSVTLVQVLSGGEGYTDSELIVECSGECTGQGLEGTCVADHVGSISSVSIRSHGHGYTASHPPKLSCKGGQVPAILLGRVASGAVLSLTRAAGAVLSAHGKNDASPRFQSGRVVRLNRGSGRTVGCTPQDKLVAVGGGGKGFMARILSVHKDGQIRDIVLSQGGSGYSTAPDVISTNPSCRCIPPTDDGSVNDGTVSGGFKECFSLDVSQYSPSRTEWQIQVHVIDSSKDLVVQYVGGLQPVNRVAVAELGSAAGMMMERGSIGAKRTSDESKDISQFFKGEIGEVLMYGCSESTDELLGCTTPADIDRLAVYLANKFDVRWSPTYGVARQKMAAMSLVQGEGGSGAMPLVKAVRPNFSIGHESQMITVMGRNMGAVGEDDAVKVRLGMRDCQKPQIVERDSEGTSLIRCLAPPGYSHQVDVTVSLYGISSSLPKAYHFGAAEATRVEPATVSSMGGGMLTVHGSGFLSSPPFSVSLTSHNSSACTNLVVHSDTLITCSLPSLYAEEARLALTVDGQEEKWAKSSKVRFFVSGAPDFARRCRPSNDCLPCCLESCRRWASDSDAEAQPGLVLPSASISAPRAGADCEMACPSHCGAAGQVINSTDASGALLRAMSV